MRTLKAIDNFVFNSCTKMCNKIYLLQYVQNPQTILDKHPQNLSLLYFYLTLHEVQKVAG